jgi:hypothetical protein
MARSGLTGDFGKLRRMAGSLQRLGGASTVRALALNLAEESIERIQEGFAGQRDPYGRRWRKKVFPDGRPVLVGKTARLRRGWHVASATAHGFRVSPSVWYAITKQRGSGIYGPHGRRIRARGGARLGVGVSGPRSSRALAIPLPSGGTLFRRSVAGERPRLMVPTRSRGLPRAWRLSFVHVAKDFIRSRLST